MVDYTGIQNKIDIGRGKASSRIGQPYNVYRPGVTNALNYADAVNQIATSYKVFKRHLTNAKDLETSVKQGTFWYEMVGNMRGFLVGDLFIQDDPTWGVGSTAVDFSTMEFNGMVLTFHGPVKKAMGARVDRFAQIYRMNPEPDSNNYWLTSILNALPVVLNNGVFSLGTPNQMGAFIPVGLIPHERTYGTDLIELVPTSPKHTLWNCYVPPLNGFLPTEGDRIVMQSGAQYSVVHPYHQNVGNVGSQLIVQREVS